MRSLLKKILRSNHVPSRPGPHNDMARWGVITRSSIPTLKHGHLRGLRRHGTNKPTAQSKRRCAALRVSPKLTIATTKLHEFNTEARSIMGLQRHGTNCHHKTARILWLSECLQRKQCHHETSRIHTEARSLMGLSEARHKRSSGTNNADAPRRKVTKVLTTATTKLREFFGFPIPMPIFPITAKQKPCLPKFLNPKSVKNVFPSSKTMAPSMQLTARTRRMSPSCPPACRDLFGQTIIIHACYMSCKSPLLSHSHADERGSLGTNVPTSQQPAAS
jgi:hypothetical protein